MAKEILNSAAIKLNDIKKYITANVGLQLKQKAAPRLYMVGAPGCGKSDIMRQICQENGVLFVDLEEHLQFNYLTYATK